MQYYQPIIFSGNQVIIWGNIVQSIRQNIIITIKGITPLIISPMVTPNSGGAVPRHTKIDIAIGGVWNAICKLIQTIIAAHNGSKD